MKKIISLSIVALLFSSIIFAQDGLVRLESNYSVQETADRFEEFAIKKGANIFARINYHENAASVDLEMRPTELIIFGNPKVGTPLMNCAQEVGIDLPLKVLIYENEDKKVLITYNDPNYFKTRHKIIGCETILTKMSGMLSSLSAAAVEKP